MIDRNPRISRHLSWPMGLLLWATLASCRTVPVSPPVAPTPSPEPSASPAPHPDAPREQPLTLLPDVPTAASDDLLQQSWEVYRQRFIQEDGRVIDWEAEGRSTSESQAYAMLRAVLIDDPETFARTLKWGEDNLQRPGDRLWAWKWGESSQEPGRWGITDGNFAIDADIDAATALILASRRWNRPDYLALAKVKLQEIWRLAVVTMPQGAGEGAGDRHYLLPGPRAAFVRPGEQEGQERLILNPSYYAPYAFRIFAPVDPERDWSGLAADSYWALNGATRLSAAGLPADWILVDPQTQQFSPLEAGDSLKTQYAFDAYRVWWRVALDAVWFQEAAAEEFLQNHLGYLETLWRSQGRIPAQLDLSGQPKATYEATSQYGMLYAAFALVEPLVAQSIFQQKLWPSYQAGLWDDESAYYSQNLAWLGLFPADRVPDSWLQP